ncbi:hypothetical protein ACFW9V_18925, partial [Streptomyces hygroscopicus]
MAEEGLPGELRALGRALEIPPSGGRPADDGHPADGVPGTDGVPPEGGETLVERVIARIVGLPVPVADDRIREEQWWGPRGRPRAPPPAPAPRPPAAGPGPRRGRRPP